MYDTLYCHSELCTLRMSDTLMLQKTIWRLKDNLLQWLWFTSSVEKNHIGFDKGLLTWLRISKHKTMRKRIHIALLDIYPRGGKFGQFTAFWINENSRVCSASVNEKIEDADVVWIYSQDPLPETTKAELFRILKKKKPGTPVINHPDVYNIYHEDTCFATLREAGVSVPRSEFTDGDIGKTPVVYKTIGKHGHSSCFSLYGGPMEGFRAFEFCDSRGSDGIYKKYRAFYILGTVIPRHILLSNNWNVHRETRTGAVYSFCITENEIRMIRLIAQTLNLQYFAVDFIRRASDSFPVFTDINVYPLLTELTETVRGNGYYGRWTVFDVSSRIGMPEPSGKSFWEMFDEAMTVFNIRKSVPASKEPAKGMEQV